MTELEMEKLVAEYLLWLYGDDPEDYGTVGDLLDQYPDTTLDAMTFLRWMSATGQVVEERQ